MRYYIQPLCGVEMAITISLVGNVYHLAGSFDEHLDLSPLAALPRPLHLSLAEVESINSHGVRAWLVFIQDNFQAQLFFHNCSSPFIDMANMMEGFLYWGPRVDRVKSVILPFICEKCAKSSNISIAADKVKFFQGGAMVPAQRCPTCAVNLTCETDLGEYFAFMTLK